MCVCVFLVHIGMRCSVWGLFRASSRGGACGLQLAMPLLAWQTLGGCSMVGGW